jgi:hypothetical protein
LGPAKNERGQPFILGGHFVGGQGIKNLVRIGKTENVVAGQIKSIADQKKDGNPLEEEGTHIISSGRFPA